ncbi:hypothetical protein WMY93_000131 [Mugilogobius chulae]|uniref:SID1 transmembrane family member 1 n=1 Tax=Mugilogobius chulae TaxID=88201 RepID=A0AAW0Q6P9_9GOBI
MTRVKKQNHSRVSTRVVTPPIAAEYVCVPRARLWLITANADHTVQICPRTWGADGNVSLALQREHEDGPEAKLTGRGTVLGPHLEILTPSETRGEKASKPEAVNMETSTSPQGQVTDQVNGEEKLPGLRPILEPGLGWMFTHELLVARLCPRGQARLKERCGRSPVDSTPSQRDRVRSSVTQEELGVEPLLLHMELKRLKYLFQKSPGCPHVLNTCEVFRTCPIGWRAWDDPGHDGGTCFCSDLETPVNDREKYLFVSDLAKMEKSVLNNAFIAYLWNIVTIAVFYGLPVFQLVVAYQHVAHVTGNQDICYSNFLCAHPVGPFSSFNNILSNLGYVLLGLIFLLIVFMRELKHKRALENDDTNAQERGIPKHFGVYYAMGTALMMEGVLSACYHVCPNYENFSSVAEDGSIAFWIVFTFFHLGAALALSLQIYYAGRWSLVDFKTSSLFQIRMLLFNDLSHIFFTAWENLRSCSRPMYPDRMVLLVLVNLVNVIIAIFGLVTRPSNFDTYLLGIAIANLLLYLAWYIILKGINILTLLLILFTGVVWGFALYFFKQHLTTWRSVTPAESREHNKECILWSFFDDHDIWHFLSSIAMFGSFLIILTLDDDLDSVDRNKIHVF